MIKLIEILILIVPAVSWKLCKDRNGTTHPNNEPTMVLLIMVVCVFIVAALPHSHKTGLYYFECLSVSITGYALIFPYAFNFYWYSKNRIFIMSITNKLKYKLYYTFNHLSDTAIPDKWKLWRSLGWFGRLLVYVVLFIISLYWFF